VQSARQAVHWKPRLGLAGELRRRSPPATAVSRRPPPLSRSRASVAVRSRSNAPDLIQPPRFARVHLQLLDLDPMDLDLVNRVNPAGPGTFAENPHVF
jgi:hypothetical protein